MRTEYLGARTLFASVMALLLFFTSPAWAQTAVQDLDRRDEPSFAFGEDEPLEVPRMYELTITGEPNTNDFDLPPDDYKIELGYDCSAQHPCTGDPILVVEHYEPGFNPPVRQYVSDDLNTSDLNNVERHGEVSFQTEIRRRDHSHGGYGINPPYYSGPQFLDR